MVTNGLSLVASHGAALHDPFNSATLTSPKLVHVTKFGCQMEMLHWPPLDLSYALTLKKFFQKISAQQCWSLINHPGFFIPS